MTATPFNMVAIKISWPGPMCCVVVWFGLCGWGIGWDVCVMVVFVNGGFGRCCVCVVGGQVVGNEGGVAKRMRWRNHLEECGLVWLV